MLTACFGVYLGDRVLQDGPVRVWPVHAFARELSCGRVLRVRCPPRRPANNRAGSAPSRSGSPRGRQPAMVASQVDVERCAI